MFSFYWECCVFFYLCMLSNIFLKYIYLKTKLSLTFWASTSLLLCFFQDYLIWNLQNFLSENDECVS